MTSKGIGTISFLLAAGATVVCALAADSDDWRKIGERPAYADCVRGSGGVTAELVGCAATEQSYQDARLNSAYKRMMAAAAPAQRVTLRQAERDWIAARDRSCAIGPDSGTAGQINASSCVLDHTAAQATRLEDMIGGETTP